MLPATATVTRVESDEAAEYSNASPSGSAKYAAASIARMLSTYTSPAPIVSATAGARFGTVTAKFCVAARPSGSRAVTVTAAAPLARPVTVSMPPKTEDANTGAADPAA